MVTVAFLVPLAAVVKVVAADRATSVADQEARSLQGVLSAVPAAGLPSVLDQLNAGSSGREAAAFLPDGQEVGASLHVPAAELRLAREGRAFTTASNGQTRVWVSVRLGSGSTFAGVVMVPARLLDAGVLRAWLVLVALGLLIIVLGLLLADRLAHTMVRSVESLGSVTRRLRQGDLAARVEPDGPPEIANVGRAVNELADRIIELLATEREAAADLSHSLRTPLAALQLEADSLRSPAERRRIGLAVAGMTDAVSDVIRQVREDRSRPVATEADLAAAIRDRLAFWALLAGEQSRLATSHLPPTPVIVGVPVSELAAAIDALVGNVFAHTPEGTAFTVDLTVSEREAILTVADEGPGFPAGMVPERGYSGAGSTGLGLDIVARTAARTGGHVRLHPGSPGARVEVTFARPSSGPGR